ncbi:MAG: Phosphate transport regulator (distant homolog of PhoU) [uncultured Solirubrobacteraceae bacterium]|uniref:Phosphate transport regulator (Distant homolog of PhoU) n=1 Tax=uncultured Solirubrobacteraceae bacterium TaxID=1162706 RepID=A0A6J4SMN6_9ACTN|nr:MAG: Phosphate transport regulator (distant homolog of PhoU) [uncultured Solirubrobacteraceae bacterium]
MGRLAQLFVPKDREFFDLFEAAANTALQAAELLDRMLAEHPDHPELPSEIRELEHIGDRITHDLIHRLNTTFVTPIEREDILNLASALDDITDLVEEVADLFVLYKIEAPMEQAQELAHLLALACAELAAAMPLLRSFADFSVHIVEVNRLENEGDRVSREAVASLFDAGIDPMVVIRWKDVFERLEEGIDATERTANVLEGIRIKNA